MAKKVARKTAAAKAVVKKSPAGKKAAPKTKAALLPKKSASKKAAPKKAAVAKEPVARAGGSRPALQGVSKAPSRNGGSPKVYAVTGSSGFLGGNLVRKLLARKDIRKVVGIDVTDARINDPRFVSHKMDMRDDRLTAILKAEGVDGILHLAFIVDPYYDEKEMRDINVRGSENVLQAAEALQVKHLLVFSSTTAYGAHPDNPFPLREEDDARGNDEFQYSSDKAEVDQLTQRFAKQHPKMRVNIVRPCIVLGPNVANYIAAQFLMFPVLPKVNGKNLANQFVHEDDVVALVLRLVDRHVPGIFNAVGAGYMSLEEVAEMQGKRTLFMPEVVLRALLKLLWRLRLTVQGVPPGIVSFYCYPWVADGSKARKELGFIPTYSSNEVFRILYDNREKVIANLKEKFDKQGKR